MTIHRIRATASSSRRDVLNLGELDEAGRPPQTVLVVAGGAIVTNSFSKYFGMTGGRLGAEGDGANHGSVRVELLHLPPTLSQQAALTVSRRGLAIYEEWHVEFPARRDWCWTGSH